MTTTKPILGFLLIMLFFTASLVVMIKQETKRCPSDKLNRVIDEVNRCNKERAICPHEMKEQIYERICQ